MKKSVYYVVLSVLFLVGAYQIATFEFVKNDVWGFLKSIWSVLLFIFLFWSKKELIGKGWFSKKQTPYKPSYTLQDSMSESEHLASLPQLNETEKQAYIKLAKLCCSTKTQERLIPILEDMKDFKGDEEYLTTLNYIAQICIDKNISFVLTLDYKADIQWLELQLKKYLRQNYNVDIKLPDYKTYPKNYTINTKDNIMTDYEKALRSSGLQMGFIDVKVPVFAFVVHKVEDKERVSQLVNDIGYLYFENL